MISEQRAEHERVVEASEAAATAAYAIHRVISKRFADGGLHRFVGKQFKLASKLAETARALNDSLIEEAMFY